MELKGNIRVFCRVRPLIARERAAADSVAVVVKSKEVVAVDTAREERLFEYDRCVGSS